ncbi:MAG: 5-oxoprolinase subunit PxpB [Bacteroidetes bacterium]|nr:5-oxoprolinase subunit PxpB [Bacteroidota bacterium]
MNPPSFSYRIFPLGDSAITIDFGNCIDEQINISVLSRFFQWEQHPLAGMTELVPAYSSLTVYFDLPKVKKTAGNITAIEWMIEQAEQRLKENIFLQETPGKMMRIPVCYDSEFAPDIFRLAAANNISPEEVIALHTSKTYRVFMLGFLPGFAYMGQVDEKIAMPRKPQPVNVAADSVGVAGSQTGIYPLDSPGGWHIIGRTPWKLFDAEREEPVLLQAGDQVQFFSISKNDFREIQNSALLKESSQGDT